jgi:hypothetical protein
MKRFALFAILSILLFPAALAAKDAQPQFKNIVVKPLANAEGVTLPKGAAEAFSEHLRNKLQKINLGAQVVDDGLKVAEANAADSIVIETKVTEYKRTSFGGQEHIILDIGIFRLSDHTLIKSITPKLTVGGCIAEYCQRNGIAFAGEDAAKDIMKALK